MIKFFVPIGVAAALSAGCGGAGRGLLDDDASYKIPAIKKAVDRNDSSAAAVLVANLESEDPAVRFYAIEGLRRLTGRTFDYRYFDDEPDRRASLARWKQWLSENPTPAR